jgi:hypothetical protein
MYIYIYIIGGTILPAGAWSVNISETDAKGVNMYIYMCTYMYIYVLIFIYDYIFECNMYPLQNLLVTLKHIYQCNHI